MLWLPDAFFRLHRRRELHQNGFQPISFQEMAQFCDNVLRLTGDLRSLFFRVMEETDNGVLYDSYLKTKADLEEAKKEPPKKPRKPRRSK